MLSNTDWFRQAQWGVFTHYLTNAGTTADEWNRRVDSFDTQALARQLAATGTRYYFITIGQNSGHFCAPNATYDEFTGIYPSKCSERDLIADLYEALHPCGITLMVYLPSGAPAGDTQAVEKLDWKWGFEGGWPTWSTQRTGERLAEFQVKWEAIIRDWSLRWGDRIAGWWIDGCYFPDEMYRHADAPNFASFAAALKAGNPRSIVAFNPGVLTPVISMTEHEDYTAGEIADAFPVCPGRFIMPQKVPPEYSGPGAQYHILSYLGEQWGSGEPRFCDEFVTGYTQDVVAKGGVVTWDVPISENGSIPPAFIRQLKRLRGV